MNRSSVGHDGRSLVTVRRFRAVRRPAREPGNVEVLTDHLWSLGATAVEQRDDELRAGFPMDELAVAAADALLLGFADGLDVSVARSTTMPGRTNGALRRGQPSSSGA